VRCSIWPELIIILEPTGNMSSIFFGPAFVSIVVSILILFLREAEIGVKKHKEMFIAMVKDALEILGYGSSER
jgi:hypothetical protein